MSHCLPLRLLNPKKKGIKKRESNLSLFQLQKSNLRLQANCFVISVP